MYRGKLYDGFSYALNTLFCQCGIEAIPFWDCFAQKNIIFSFGTHISEWCRPVFSWHQYMPILFENLGIQEEYQFCKTSNHLEQLPTGTIFLIGEVQIPEWDITIMNRFCPEIHAFLVCEKQTDYFIVSNPAGSIYFKLNSSEFMNVINGTDSFLFSVSNYLQITPKPVSLLAKETLMLENKFGGFLKFENKFPVISQSTKEKTAFQYRLIHYLTSRTLAAEFYGMSNHFFNVLSEISVSKNFSDFKKIIYAEKIFYEELSYIQEKK